MTSLDGGWLARRPGSGELLTHVYWHRTSFEPGQTEPQGDRLVAMPKVGFPPTPAMSGSNAGASPDLSETEDESAWER